MPSEQYIVKPLVGALRILDVLRHSDLPLSLFDIASGAALSKTTAFRYLKTFQRMGYVIYQKERTYSLGLSALSLSGDDRKETTLKYIAHPHMVKLAQLFSETVNLGVPKGKHIHYLSVIEPKRTLRLKAEPGDADHFHSTALGKAMVAFMPPELADLHLKLELPRLTNKTIVARSKFNSALVMVRSLGYAIDREENEVGCVCYAAPIFGVDKLPIAAISISVPTPRLNDQLDLEIPEAIKVRAASITEAMMSEEASTGGRWHTKSKRGNGSHCRSSQDA